MKYSFDSYGLYTDETIIAYTIRFCVKMKENVDFQILCQAANEAITRYPYFAVKVLVDEDGGYVLEHNDAPIAVHSRDKKVHTLGSPEVNYHLCFLEYEGDEIDFYISHSLAGGRGASPWIMTTVYQYVCDYYHIELDAPGIFKPGEPLLPGEDQSPSFDDLTSEEPIFTHKSKNQAIPVKDYLNGIVDPFMRNQNYWLVIVQQQDLLKVMKANDASVSSFFSIVMAKAMDKLLPNTEKHRVIGGEIAQNQRDSLPMKNTHCNVLSPISVDYDRSFLKSDLEKLGTMTRGRMILQTDPSVTHATLRKVLELNESVDQIHGLKQKRNFMKKNDPTIGTDNHKATYYISYSGQMDWGEVADYIQSYAIVADGHLILEISSLADRIFVSFLQIINTDKYVNAFRQELSELGVSSTVEGPFPKRLTRHEIPFR